MIKLISRVEEVQVIAIILPFTFFLKPTLSANSLKCVNVVKRQPSEGRRFSNNLLSEL